MENTKFYRDFRADCRLTNKTAAIFYFAGCSKWVTVIKMNDLYSMKVTTVNHREAMLDNGLTEDQVAAMMKDIKLGGKHDKQGADTEVKSVSDSN